jgi:hypothetical protein
LCQDWQKATINKNIASLINERPTISPKVMLRMHQLAMQKEGVSWCDEDPGGAKCQALMAQEASGYYGA